MTYVDNSGEIHQGRKPLTFPWFKELICSIFTFFYLLFASLFGFGSQNQRGSSSNGSGSQSRSSGWPGGGGGRGGGDFRPPSGSNNPPRHRNVRGLGGYGGSSPSCPPMAGGG